MKSAKISERRGRGGSPSHDQTGIAVLARRSACATWHQMTPTERSRIKANSVSSSVRNTKELSIHTRPSIFLSGYRTAHQHVRGPKASVANRKSYKRKRCTKSSTQAALHERPSDTAAYTAHLLVEDEERRLPSSAAAPAQPPSNARVTRRIDDGVS